MSALTHPRARLAILVLVALAVRALTFGNPVVHVDEEFYCFTGSALWHGQLPFVDVWDRKPIGLFLLYAVPAGLGFPSGIWAYQLLALGATIWAAMQVAWLATRAGFARGATAGGIAYILWLDLLGGQGGQSPVFYNPLVAAAALLILGAAASPHRRVRGALAMTLIGIALQIKYSVLLEGMFFGLWLLADEWHATRRPMALVGHGAALVALALLPTVAAGVAYAAIGQWDAFAYANFLSIFHRNPDPLKELAGNLGQIVLITSPLVALAILALRRAPRAADRHHDRTRRFLAWWLGVACLSVLAFRPWFDHYSLPILLPACAAAAGMLGSAAWQRWRTPALLLTAALAGQIVLVALRAERGEARQFAALAQAVGDGPGCLYVYSGSTMLYVATKRCALSKYIVPAHLGRTREAGATGVDQQAEIARILAQHPAVVVMRPPYGGERPAAHAFVTAALAPDYRQTAALPMGNETSRVYKRAR